MSDIEKKFSLLNDLNNIIEQEGTFYSQYIFDNIDKIIINGLEIRIPKTQLLIELGSSGMGIEIIYARYFYFTIEYEDLYDFHLIIRGE